MSHDEFPTGNHAVVTCGLPYANGDLHIGHLRTYVGGDAYARALRKLGQRTAFVSGSDMHGTPVAVNADEAGVSPEEFALSWHERYEETFPEFDVEFDSYGHTHDETNTALTREIVRALDDAGYVYEDEIMVAFDPVDEQPLPDRYVEGTCPYCGAHARGDECDEGCGRHLEPGEILEPTSIVTGNPAEYRERTHKFFRVSDLQEYLLGFIDRLEGTANARNQPREWIEGELQDWCITRDLDWGIDYPDDGESDLVLYVWVDAPIEYVSATKQYTERVGADAFDWEAAWKAGAGADADVDGQSRPEPEPEREPQPGAGSDADVEREPQPGAGSDADAEPEPQPEAGSDADVEREPATGSAGDGEIVHVIGRDIIQHHTVFWPAMLRVAGYTEPRAVMASGFITLEGKGFSTSRDRAVWADEYLEEGFDPDLLRYYLATNGGFQQDVDFSWSKFRDRVNGELVGTVGNFVYRSLLFAHRNYDGTPDAPLSPEVEARIDEAVEEFTDAVNDYSVRGVGEAAVRLARFGNEYIQRNEPWKLVDDEPDAARQVIRDCVQLATAVAVLFEPVAPAAAERVWASVGAAGDVHDVELEATLERPADEFGEPTELFEKIADERVEELTAKLDDRVAAATDAEAGDGEDAADAPAGETDGPGADADADADTDAAVDLEPVLEERVSFEEFQALDLRVGRVLEAEPIEGADELVRLVVDIGVEERQVVAGIRQLHDVDALPGTRIVLVANLEKAELFGVESDGMLLAAGEDADLLTTLGDAVPGERVR
jgi:methionyl-tRNA synthetase